MVVMVRVDAINSQPSERISKWTEQAVISNN